jgi:hypothetical protein
LLLHLSFRVSNARWPGDGMPNNSRQETPASLHQERAC